MASWSALATQVHALDLGVTVGDPVLLVRGPSSPQRVGINIRTTCNASGSTFVLLRLGLSAACSLYSPIGHYHAFLRINSLFSRGVVSAKNTNKQTQKRLWYRRNGAAKPGT